jgi:hypothetical protein
MKFLFLDFIFTAVLNQVFKYRINYAVDIPISLIEN